MLKISRCCIGEDKKISILKYSEKEYLEEYILKDCGDDYRIADWSDLVTYDHMMDTVVDYLQEDFGFEKLLITNKSDHFYDYRRHYIVNFNNEDSDFLPHEKLHFSTFILSSWYNLEERVLCIKK